MRKGLGLALIWLLFMVMPVFAGGNKFSVEVNPGYTFVGHDDELTKVSEYESARSSATAGVKAEGEIGLLRFKGRGYYRERNDKEWGLEADFGRIFRLDYDYQSFIHRLQHDNLYKNEPRMPKAIPPNKVRGLSAFNPFWRTDDPDILHLGGAQMVATDDLDSGRDYQIFRSEQKTTAKLQLPFFPYVTLRTMFRKEREAGWRQHTLMTGKCTPCHMVGTGRRINQFTYDVEVGGTLKYGVVTVDYSHLWRHFDNQAGQPRIQFDYIVAPKAETDMFRRRILYDSEYDYARFFSGGGFVPTNIEKRRYAEIPDIEKHTDKLKLRVDLPYRTTAFGYFVYSNVENSYVDKDYDLTVYGLRLTTRPVKNLMVSLKTKYYTIDNDDVKVNLSKWSNDEEGFDNVYRSWGAKDASYFNYKRKSNMDRDVWESGIDVRYNFKKYYLRAGYKYTYINRDHTTWKDYVYNDEVNGLYDEKFLKDDTTKIHDLKITLGGHPINTLNFRLTYKFQHQQDPFMNHKGVGFHKDFALPKPGGVPYYHIFRNRYRDAHDGTNVPDTTHEIKLTADWTPTAKVVASLNLSYKYQENDDSDWEAETYVAGLNFFLMPVEKLTVNLGANYEYDTYDTRMCADLFGG